MSEIARLTTQLAEARGMMQRAELRLWAKTQEANELKVERDEAQAEVERLRATGQGMLDTSRQTDEDIWREAFMRQLFDHDIEKLMGAADLALALYRKRWPR